MENTKIRIQLCSDNMTTASNNIREDDYLTAKPIDPTDVETGKCYVLETKDGDIFVRLAETKDKEIYFYSPNPKHANSNLTIHKSVLNSVFTRISEVHSFSRFM